MFDTVEIEVKLEPSVIPTKKYLFKKSQMISIGRNRDNLLHFNHDFVSRYHGAIYHINQKWYYEDFSSIGSFLERKKNRSNVRSKRIEVFENDKIIFEWCQGAGSYTFRYTIFLKNL